MTTKSWLGFHILLIILGSAWSCVVIQRANLESTSCIGRLFCLQSCPIRFFLAVMWLTKQRKLSPYNYPSLSPYGSHHLEWEKVKVPLYSSYMVSFQALPSPNGRKSIPELDDSSKKRKWEESQTEGILEKRSKPESTKSFFEEIELHRETPLPLEWQRCLDIQVLLHIVWFVCIIIIHVCVYQYNNSS